MKETILVFKNRAENFEKNAICLFNEGIFDLAAFNIEQARRCSLKLFKEKFKEWL